MDSHELISALLEANHKAGFLPCRVVIQTRKARRCLERRGTILLQFDPAPPAASHGEHYKPTITLTSITA